MQERLIQEFWQAKCLGNFEFKSSENQTIFVRDFGIINHSQGPDFTGAQVQIENMIFYGEIEVHVNASDWVQHNHQFDEKYNSVILHVVWNNDKPIHTEKGNLLPTIELSSFFREKDLQNVQIHNAHFQEFPCEVKVKEKIPEKSINEQLSAVFTNRMARKFEKLESNLIALKGDWVRLLVQTSSEYWFNGLNKDAVNFQIQHLKTRWLMTFTPEQLMAYFLCFGRDVNADLDEFNAVFGDLKVRYQIEGVNFPWYNGGVFPSSNVNLRLKQFAMWLYFLRKIDFDISLSDIENLKLFFSNFNHELAKMNIQKLGSDFMLRIKLNVFIPLAVFKQEPLNRIKSSKDMMDSLKFENNQITRKFYWLDSSQLNATQSQALLEQYKYFCKPHACLVCKIGKTVLKMP